MTTRLHICITCKKGEIDPDPNAAHAVARLYAALCAQARNQVLPQDLQILPVECLSACNNGCAVALSSPRKWGYVYGHMSAETDTVDILDGAVKYTLSPDGIVPWRERPVQFRKQSLARIPPMEQK